MASDVTFPLLDAADAERMLAYAQAQREGYRLPSAEFTHISEQINRVIVEDRFVGCLEDATPAARYLEAREILSKSAGTIEDVNDSYLIVAIGAVTGRPDLVSAGYSRVAHAWMEFDNRDTAQLFAHKAADAGNPSLLEALAAAREAAPEPHTPEPRAPEAAVAESDPLTEAPAAPAPEGAPVTRPSVAELRKLLDAAKSGDVKAHHEEFVAINDFVAESFAATGADNLRESGLLKDALEIVLESAVGALWATPQASDRQRVAKHSFAILSALRSDGAYRHLPSGMLARFYEDAARNFTNDEDALAASYAFAAHEYASAGNERRELDMLLKQVELGLLKTDPAEAHDLLASRYVKAVKQASIPLSSKWTVLYSETLRTEADNMFKSTQVLLDYLEKHPIKDATGPAEYNGMAEVAELLGDRYAAGGDTEHSRSMYHLAYNLFSAAGNTKALNSLSAKA